MVMIVNSRRRIQAIKVPRSMAASSSVRTLSKLGAFKAVGLFIPSP
jgi:hypothetical protein